MHVGSLGGTWGVPPDTPGHAKSRPGGFMIDFESFWGPCLEAFGDPLRPSWHPPSQQAGQRRQSNGLKLPTMERSRHKLSFRTASGGPRPGIWAESAINSGVLARCQCHHFGTKSRPGDTVFFGCLVHREHFGGPVAFQSPFKTNLKKYKNLGVFWVPQGPRPSTTARAPPAAKNAHFQQK